MAELSMNQIIHAAVRRDMARTEQALRSFPDGDRSRATQLQGAWRHLVDQLTHHHEAEDANIWPFLESRGHDATLMSAMEDEHTAMKVAMAAASVSVDALVQSPTSAQSAAAADEVAETARITEIHLDHEERDVEPLVAALEHDPEWKAVAKRLRPASMVDAANALAWMQDGAGDRELAALRATIPGPVVTVMTRVVGRRYGREIAPTWR